MRDRNLELITLIVEYDSEKGSQSENDILDTTLVDLSVLTLIRVGQTVSFSVVSALWGNQNRLQIFVLSDRKKSHLEDEYC